MSIRQRLKRRFCRHVTYYSNGIPIYPVRSVRATPENEQAFWGAILLHFTCPDCGDERLSLMTGWRGRRL